MSRIDPDTGPNHIRIIREELASGLTDLGLEIDYSEDDTHRGPQIAVLFKNPASISDLRNWICRT